jgi:hypothetical protein
MSLNKQSLLAAILAALAITALAPQIGLVLLVTIVVVLIGAFVVVSGFEMIRRWWPWLLLMLLMTGCLPVPEPARAQSLPTATLAALSAPLPLATPSPIMTATPDYRPTELYLAGEQTKLELLMAQNRQVELENQNLALGISATQTAEWLGVERTRLENERAALDITAREKADRAALELTKVDAAAKAPMYWAQGYQVYVQTRVAGGWEVAKLAMVAFGMLMVNRLLRWYQAEPKKPNKPAPAPAAADRAKSVSGSYPEPPVNLRPALVAIANHCIYDGGEPTEPQLVGEGKAFRSNNSQYQSAMAWLEYNKFLGRSNGVRFVTQTGEGWMAWLIGADLPHPAEG